MKTTRLMVSIFVGSLAGVAFGADATTQPAGAAEGKQPAQLAEYIRTIEQETNPTLATVAYGRATAIYPDSAALHKAYVQKMVVLGQLELAYQPAEVLTKLDPDYGLAWAVLAHRHAGRDEYEQALAAVVKAAQRAPEDPFVQDVAGQMAAWYDLKAEKDKIPQEQREALAKVREDLAKQEVFTKAYQAAKEVLQPAEQEKVFVPDHLKQPEDALSERAQRVRELIEELDRRAEERRSEEAYAPSYYYPSAPAVYYPYYYPAFLFSYADFGYWPFIFGPRFCPFRHRHDVFHHGRGLVVTWWNQKHFFGRLVVTPWWHRSLFSHSGDKLRFHGSVGGGLVGARPDLRADRAGGDRPRMILRPTGPGRDGVAERPRISTEPLEAIRRRATELRERGADLGRRTPATIGQRDGNRLQLPSVRSRTIAPGSREVGPLSRVAAPRGAAAMPGRPAFSRPQAGGQPRSGGRMSLPRSGVGGFAGGRAARAR